MRTLGLPWREAVLIVVVAAGLAASIAAFAATAPGLRDEPRTASTDETKTDFNAKEQSDDD